MTSFSALYSRIFLCRKLHGHLALPKGLIPSVSKLMDLVRKYRDKSALPTLFIERMGKGDYGLAGLRMYAFREFFERNDPLMLTSACSASLGDWTMSAEYEKALKAADETLWNIANKEQAIKSPTNQIPVSILKDLQLSKQNGQLEPTLLCRCYLFSLALFDANPMVLTKVFAEIFKEEAASCQKAFVTIIKRRIKASGNTIRDFASIMYPNAPDPRKALDISLSDAGRIIQPDFINRFAQKYYVNCFPPAHKKDGLEEYMSMLWNFVIQSSICLDRMSEKLKFDFRNEARKNYNEYLKCAESFYTDFSINP